MRGDVVIMPEIPEMEIYKNYLNKWVKDKRINDVNVLRAKSVNLESQIFCRNVIGRTIKNVTRRGKYLIFHLDSGHFLLTHMMLDGRLYLLPIESEGREDYLSAGDLMSKIMKSDAETLKQQIKGLPGKPSVVFGLDSDRVLLFCSLTLGYLHYLSQDKLELKLDELGSDPLDPNFNTQELTQLLKGRKGMIKPWLMNPHNISGVGNAYSNEALFGSGILPNRIISAISSSERASLYNSLTTILRDSIRLGGDMEEPFAPWDDFTGGYNPFFKVYERSGKPCFVCQSIIQKTEIGGRNAFYCPNCQK
jgi:formamidopyrimidine-DNA glycosylase